MNLIDCLKFLESMKELNTSFESQEFFLSTRAEVEQCAIPLAAESHQSKIVEAHQQLINSYAQYQAQLTHLTQSVQNHIEQLDQTHLVTSFNTWQGGEQHAESKHILERNIQIDPITKEILALRLQMKTGWQWPCLVLRPALAWHLEKLVACDPVYFVDTDMALLSVTDSWFTPEYQQRLCKYVYKETQSAALLSTLPSNQFGLIYVPTVLNFRPLELITQYLKEFFSLLRPGGFLLFTFNNCDTVSAAQLFDRFSGSYVPYRLLKPVVQSIGYEIVYEFNDAKAMSWLELRKPGQLTSIRSAQTLAIIRSIQQDQPPVEQPSIPVAETDRGPPIDLDPHDTVMYNEVNILLSLCEMLNISYDKTLVKGQTSVKKMRKLIAKNLHSDQFPTEKITRLLEKRKQK